MGMSEVQHMTISSMVTLEVVLLDSSGSPILKFEPHSYCDWMK